MAVAQFVVRGLAFAGRAFPLPPTAARQAGAGAMRRLVALGAAMFVAFAADAQPPPKVVRIGYLTPATEAAASHQVAAFARGMAEHGYTVGRNLALDARYADGDFARLPALAKELEARKVDVLFAPSALAAGAARRAGFARPIVFALAPDPVGEGLAASLARPGGQLTGLTSQSPELGAKRVELLRDALPKAARLAVLYASTMPGAAELPEVQRAAKAFGMDVLPVDVARPADFDAAFAQAVAWRADALIVVENPIFYTQRKALVDLAERHRLPAIYRAREYAQAGGLMSYGADYADLCRRAAVYVDRILKGAQPGDLPIEQPVKFDFVINQKAARTLGIAIGQSLLLRADEVIQ